MKHLFALVSALLLLTSCFKDIKSEQKYTVMASFDYKDATFNSDSLMFTTNETGGFAWNDLAFFHKLNDDDTRLEGGFALSKMHGRTSAVSGVPVNQYRLYCVGAEKDNIYTVFKQNEFPSLMPKAHIAFLNSMYGTCNPVGMFIANSEKVVEQVKETFEDGDSLTVRAKGFLKDQPTGQVKINLAKFSASKDSIVSTWTPFELSKLGNIDRIDFEVLSTKEGIDKIFCMDNFIANVHLVY